mmetsp:Transcript_8402/g.18944  ORF Transcript_8402/g.18944 Transcript_8402/m.18944 type:complete len:1013 (+) Transcript_8402:439-3477(+)
MPSLTLVPASASRSDAAAAGGGGGGGGARKSDTVPANSTASNANDLTNARGSSSESSPSAFPHEATYQSLRTQARMLNDMTELVCYDIIFAPSSSYAATAEGDDEPRREMATDVRFDRSVQLNYCLGRLGDSYDFGRLHTYYYAMEYILFVCAHPVTSNGVITADGDGDDHHGAAAAAAAAPSKQKTNSRRSLLDRSVPLLSYNTTEWTKLISKFRKLRNAFLRGDANAAVLNLSFVHCLDETSDSHEPDENGRYGYTYRPVSSAATATATDGISSSTSTGMAEAKFVDLTPGLLSQIESHDEAQILQLVNEEPSPHRQVLPTFSADYAAVLDRLQLHKAIGGLKHKLEGIVDGTDDDDAQGAFEEGYTDPPAARTRNASAAGGKGRSPARGRSPAKKDTAGKEDTRPTKKEITAKKKEVQTEINSFLENVTNLLTARTGTDAKSAADEEDDQPSSSSSTAAFAEVQKMIADFSAYLTNGIPHIAQHWAQRCLTELQGVEVELLVELRIKVEALVQDWCRAVLDEPTLVNCGYFDKPAEPMLVPPPLNNGGGAVPVSETKEDEMEIERALEEEEEIIMAQDDSGDDDDEDIPPADDDDDDEDATVGKPTPKKLYDEVETPGKGFDDVGSVNTSSPGSEAYESQPQFLTQAEAPFTTTESPIDEARDDEPVTPSRMTRRSANFEKKSISKVISESAGGASMEAPADTPASASRRRRGGRPASASKATQTPSNSKETQTPGSSIKGKTPIRRSSPKQHQDDSDFDYKGTPKKPAATSRLGRGTPTRKASSKANRKLEKMTPEDSESSSDDEGFTASGYTRHPATKTKSGTAKPKLTHFDSSAEGSDSDDALSSPRKKKARKGFAAAIATAAGRAAAAKTPTPRTKKSKKKKGSHTPRLTGYKVATSSSSSEYEQDNSSGDDDSVPSPGTNVISTPRIQPQSNRGVNVPRSSGRKRKKWTEEEKDAVREGVEAYGVGRWAVIKSEWAMALQDRTSVQIKDCYRTMLKRGEISDDV